MEMLEKVPDTMDKREGSVIYDALAPCAAALKNAYIAMEDILLESFIGTASGKYLDLIAKEFGLERNPASYAMLKGEFNINVEIGTRFNGDENNYIVSGKISDGVFRLICETAGKLGNDYIGVITPIEYIEGLERAFITEVLIAGSDEETDDELRKRVISEISHASREGNVYQYIKWANEYEGIGNVRVFPLWNGCNTVKVSILDANNGKATDSLISDFQNYLDPESKGLGNGKAPIGACVKVSTANEVRLSVNFDFSLNQGFDKIYGLNEELKDYLRDLSYNQDVLSFYGLASKILENTSVASITNLKINGSESDIDISGEKIPVLNSVNGEAV